MDNNRESRDRKGMPELEEATFIPKDLFVAMMCSRLFTNDAKNEVPDDNQDETSTLPNAFRFPNNTFFASLSHKFFVALKERKRYPSMLSATEEDTSNYYDELLKLRSSDGNTPLFSVVRLGFLASRVLPPWTPPEDTKHATPVKEEEEEEEKNPWERTLSFEEEGEFYDELARIRLALDDKTLFEFADASRPASFVRSPQTPPETSPSSDDK